jgi:hypothetical protein
MQRRKRVTRMGRSALNHIVRNDVIPSTINKWGRRVFIFLCLGFPSLECAVGKLHLQVVAGAPATQRSASVINSSCELGAQGLAALEEAGGVGF